MFVTVIERSTNEVLMNRCPVGYSQPHEEIESNVCANLGYRWGELRFEYGRA